jgi:hypothetical protein
MLKRKRYLLYVLAAVAVSAVGLSVSQADAFEWRRGRVVGSGVYSDGAVVYEGSAPFSTYNYYVPGYEGGPPAQLYVSPRPVPPLVGHTYITYPPLNPHEFLYRHKRTYSRVDPDGGTTKTRVRWAW